MSLLDTPDLWLLVAALIAAGALTGLLSGFLGIGGGGVMVPILYELFRVVGVDDDVRTHLAVGTSLAVIVPTSIRSFLGHRARGAVDEEVLRSMLAALMAGVLIGIVITSLVDGSVLRAVYAISTGVMAVKLAVGTQRGQLGNTLPGGPVRQIVAGATGVISTLIGIGGGVFVTAFMTLYGRTIHQGVATASGFGPAIAIPAVLGYVWAGWGVDGLPPGSIGYVSLIGAGLMIPTAVLVAPLGVHLAHGVSRRTLELCFAAFLTFVAVRFVFSLLD